MFFDYYITDKVSLGLDFTIHSLRKNYQVETKSSIKNLLNLLNMQDMGNIPDSTIADLVNLVSDYANTDIITRTESSTNLTYLKVPLKVSYSHKNLKFSAGPYASFLLKALTKEVTTQEIPLLKALTFIDDIEGAKYAVSMLYPGYYSPDEETNTKKKQYNEWDYGFVAGISYTFDSKFFISASYSYGLENFYKREIEGYSTWRENHSFVRFSLGYDIGKSEIVSKVMF
ncbi:MAG: hypothetical protein C0594_14590 [Marinilabiliales bacterium]|nr:MAG: hypothetical protein C0594_14590 [Marinilabiliales bacterium]